MNLEELHLPDHHRETLNRFVAACQADERIVAAFLGGSYAHQAADRYSDLDMYFVTTDEAYEDFLVERERFLHRLGEPLVKLDFGNPHGYTFILSNGGEGEIWFGRESDFIALSSGPHVVLVDKKNLLDEEVFPSPVPDPAEQLERLQQMLDGFWHDSFHFIKAMARKQLWFAYGELEIMRRQCVTLARLKHNFGDPYADENEPFFKIELYFPVESLAPLQATFCPLEYEAMRQAGLALARFYQKLAPGLAEEHHLVYHAELERLLFQELQELRGAERREKSKG